jgi:hypothetical protein
MWNESSLAITHNDGHEMRHFYPSKTSLGLNEIRCYCVSSNVALDGLQPKDHNQVSHRFILSG